MLQGYGDTVLRAEMLEKELNKARKHSAMLQSKLDGAFAQYHNEVHEMQAKSDGLIRKNKLLRQKKKGIPWLLVEYLFESTCQMMRSGQPTGVLIPVVYLFGGEESKAKNSKVAHKYGTQRTRRVYTGSGLQRVIPYV
jgi:hypothetical protein